MFRRFFVSGSVSGEPAVFTRPRTPAYLGPTWSVGRATIGEANRRPSDRQYLGKAGTPDGEPTHGGRNIPEYGVVVRAFLSSERPTGVYK